MLELTALIPIDGTQMSETVLELLPWLKSIGVHEVRLVSVWGGSLGPSGRRFAKTRDARGGGEGGCLPPRLS
jgi:hypothetical protein